MKKHADEIIAWANSPEGTKVWCRRKSEKRWIQMLTPSWYPENDYVVDGPRAKEQMQAIEERSQ